MFFCREEGTALSFHGVSQTIARHGLFCALYTDRGSHYFHTPEAGGKADRSNPTQFGGALAQLGIEHIAAYSPEVRRRSERAFGTHQERLPRELAKAGVADMQQANACLDQVYLPRHNAEFTVPAREPGSAFVPYTGSALADIRCEHHERTVGNGNCASFETLKLQIPADGTRPQCVKRQVHVHRYVDGMLAVFYGPRLLARYDVNGVPAGAPVQLAA